MNISFFLLLIIILFKLKAGYESISLKYDSENYYIPIKLSQNNKIEYFIFTNILPINIFPSSKCSICKSYHINEKDKNSYSFIRDNVLVPYYYLNFTGDLYQSNFTLGSHSNVMEFVAFDNITDTDNYKGKGRFSLSFLNYNFNTSKKIFALTLKYTGGKLELGDYNKEIFKNDESNLNIFNITKTNYNSTHKYLNMWYINFTSLYINNNNNLKGNYNYKFSFDISTDYFHIPKDFFFKNAEYIFSEDSKCQVQPEGYFICVCNQNFNKKFADFKFVYENNNYIEVKITDYIMFDETGAGNYCYVLIKINYETDVFIAGKYVMNNYYTIFDIDNNQLKVYKTNKGNINIDQRNIIIILFVLCSGGLLFLCCYCIYKNYCQRDTDEENLNEDLIEDNIEDEANDQENQRENNEEQNIENNDLEINDNNINNINNEENQNIEENKKDEENNSNIKNDI